MDTLQSIRIRSVDAFWQPGVDPAVLRMRHEAYSALRHEKMKALRDSRRRIIAEEEGGDSPGKTKGHGSGGGVGRDTARSGVPVSGAIDIEKVKKKQQKEIEAMMAYEMKMQEITEEQERKQVCGSRVLVAVRANRPVVVCVAPRDTLFLVVVRS